jgi:tetratricopeptide (TPR) repeat protein
MKYKNLYILITIVITLYPLAACKSSGGAVPQPETAPKLPISETLAQAADLFAQRKDIAKLREAVDLVAKLREPDNRSFEVEWTFAKYNYFLGKAAQEEAEKEKIFEDGKKAGQIASRLRPDQPEGYFWYGANLGELSKISPITVGLKSIDDIREAMNKVIELQPGYQGASAYDALAQIELTPVVGGKAEKAVEYLEKGIEIEPTNSNMHLHLAQAYLKVDKKAKAKEQLEYVITMKPDSRYLPEHEVTLAAAKKLLASRF